MTLMEKVQEQCQEGSDVWIDGMELDGRDPFQHLVNLQEAVKRIGEEMLKEPNTKMVALPAEMFAELVTIANVGKHVVVVRLLERGLVSADEIHLGTCDDCEKKGGCSASQ